ncbi:MAG: glycosyltransferase family 4 protein [Deferrisomatales bacterium]
MKVLVFTSLYPNSRMPNFGIFIRQRMTHFAQLEGCSIRVVAPVPYFPRLPWATSYARYSEVPRQERDGETVVHHPRYFMLPKVSMVVQWLSMFLGAYPTVRAIQREYDFDLIDGHYIYPDGLAAILLGKVFRKPVVLSARGSDINQFADFPLIRPMIRFALRRADQLISVCGALRDRMVELGADPRKTHVIPNGVDLERFEPMDRSEARRILGVDPKQRFFLSVGGLIPRKGFDLLIRAFREVQQRDGIEDACLYIVGEGPARGELQSLIDAEGVGRHVFLVGEQANDRLKYWYNAADVFCLASSREGWANVIMEALACGTPVVSSMVWGAPEIITSEEVGCLAARTIEAFSESMTEAIRGTWKREGIRSHVSNRSWDRVAGEVAGVFSLSREALRVGQGRQVLP